jgi:hypothetical protein
MSEKDSSFGLILIIVGAAIGLITGGIFFALKADWIISFFPDASYDYLSTALIFVLFLFSLAGALVGWLFDFLR